MKIEDRTGESVDEATVTVDNEELYDLLEGLADLMEGKKQHLHFTQPGGPQLVVRRVAEGDPDPLRRQMDWWVGPLVLLGVVLLLVGLVTVVRWAATLL